MDFSDLSTLDEVCKRFDTFFDEHCKKFQRLCLWLIVLAFFTLYSISYGLRKDLGLVLPIVFGLITVLIGVICYSKLSASMKQAVESYKAKISDLRQNADLNQKGLLSLRYGDYDNLSLVPESKRFFFRCLAVMLVLAIVISAYDSQKTFDSTKWNRGGLPRLMMVEDLVYRQKKCGTAADYCFSAMAEDQIKGLLCDEKQLAVPLDITVTVPDDTVNKNNKAVCCCIYTTSHGVNYWVVLIYLNYGAENQSLAQTLLMKSGMKLTWKTGEEARSCRLWF